MSYKSFMLLSMTILSCSRLDADELASEPTSRPPAETIQQKVSDELFAKAAFIKSEGNVARLTAEAISSAAKTSPEQIFNNSDKSPAVLLTLKNLGLTDELERPLNKIISGEKKNELITALHRTSDNLLESHDKIDNNASEILNAKSRSKVFSILDSTNLNKTSIQLFTGPSQQRIDSGIFEVASPIPTDGVDMPITPFVTGFGSLTVEYPAVAKISHKLTFPPSQTKIDKLCTGTLIAKDKVLTAAHCFCGANAQSSWSFNETLCDKKKLTHSNSEKISDVNVFFQHAGLYRVNEIIIHKDYDSSSLQWPKPNDIAVITLDASVDIISPAKISTVSWDDVMSKFGKLNGGLIVGFGNSRVYSPFLYGLKNKAKIDVSTCEQTLRRDPKSFVCAKYKIAGQPVTGHCGGDSGGPLFVKLTDQYELIGVISSGHTYADSDCKPLNSNAEMQHVFLGTKENNKWIRNIIEDKNKEYADGSVVKTTGLLDPVENPVARFETIEDGKSPLVNERTHTLILADNETAIGIGVNAELSQDMVELPIAIRIEGGGNSAICNDKKYCSFVDHNKKAYKIFITGQSNETFQAVITKRLQ